MKNHRRILLCRCLEKAYKAGKHIQKIRRDFSLYETVLCHQKYSRQSIFLYTNTELNYFVFIIYLSLLEYKIGLCLMNLFKFLRFRSFSHINEISKIKSCERKSKNNFIFKTSINKKLIERINRKLSWIEATLNDLYIWRRYFLFPSLLTYKIENDKGFPSKLKRPGLVVIAHESVGFLPRSITRTISRFKAELMNKSESLVLREFGLARYQALASLQYFGCLVIIPSMFSIFSQKYFSEPLIHYWWNNMQSRIFFVPLQEKKALEELERIEELSWLDKVVEDSLFKTQLGSFDAEIHQKTIELARNCNNNSIEIISHLLTDVFYLITLSGLFVTGRERLAILNSWAQELFYSLSDTMKAFSILLLTDSCVGFHSPHGWELGITFCLEHFGFVRDERIISCFVSTFPVVLDTVLKYLIFRHLNRISPSIVATYHTMSE